MTLVLGFVLTTLAAQPVPAALSEEAIATVFSGLPGEEARELAAGRPVVRSKARARSLALLGEGEPIQSIRSKFAKLGPNYFAEFLLVVPQDGAMLDRLRELLGDPRSFVGIPYYSVRNNTTYQLFDKIEVQRSSVDREGRSVIEVLQHMEPFDDYRARYTVHRDQARRSLYFAFENQDPLVYTYRNFRAAGPGDQVWLLYAFERDGFIWFYGAGGVKAFDLFGAFRERLEASFMGRIDSFFSFVMRSLGKR